MGQSLVAAAAGRDDLQVASVWVRGDDAASRFAGGEYLLTARLDEALGVADVLVDFTLPDANEGILAAALEHRKPLVCGVSGLSQAQMQGLQEAAVRIPIVYDRNMSLGIAVLEALVRRAVDVLGDEFDVVIEETHHIHKRDAPSGTALKLGEAVAETRGQSLPGVMYYDPAGSKPPPGAVEFRVQRRGEVPGDHSVTLSSATETLTLGHSVTTRAVFADGALRAALWAVGQPPGLYSMRDVLFSSA